MTVEMEMFTTATLGKDSESGRVLPGPNCAGRPYVPRTLEPWKIVPSAVPRFLSHLTA